MTHSPTFQEKVREIIYEMEGEYVGTGETNKMAREEVVSALLKLVEELVPPQYFDQEMEISYNQETAYSQGFNRCRDEMLGRMWR